LDTSFLPEVAGKTERRPFRKSYFLCSPSVAALVQDIRKSWLINPEGIQEFRILEFKG
jgi:hypothetical protein